MAFCVCCWLTAVLPWSFTLSHCWGWTTRCHCYHDKQPRELHLARTLHEYSSSSGLPWSAVLLGVPVALGVGGFLWGDFAVVVTQEKSGDWLGM